MTNFEAYAVQYKKDIQNNFKDFLEDCFKDEAFTFPIDYQILKIDQNLEVYVKYRKNGLDSYTRELGTKLHPRFLKEVKDWLWEVLETYQDDEVNFIWDSDNRIYGVINQKDS